MESQTMECQPDQRWNLQKRSEVSGAAMRIFMEIARRWELDETEQSAVLGGMPIHFLRSWKFQATDRGELALDIPVLLRISHVLNIYRGLATLYQTEREQLEWLRRPSRVLPFNGDAPVKLLTSALSRDIEAVRTLVDAACTGLFMSPNEVDRNFVQYEDSDIYWR